MGKKEVFFVSVFVILFLVNGVLVVSYTPTQLNAEIDGLRAMVDEFRELGLATNRFEDMIEQAEIALEDNDYNMTNSIILEAKALKQKAIVVNKELGLISEKITLAEEQGINISRVKTMFDSASLEIKLENYESAELILIEADGLLNGLIKDGYKPELVELIELKGFAKGFELSVEGIEDVYSIMKRALDNGDLDQAVSISKRVEILNKSLSSIQGINLTIVDMRNNNLSTSRIEDMLEEAKVAFNLVDYDRVVSLYQEVNGLYEKSIEIQRDINRTRLRIDGAKSHNIDVSEAEKLFEEGVKEFELSNYEDAEVLIKQSFEKVEEIEASSLLFGTISKSELKTNFFELFKRFWWAIILFLLGFVLLGREVYFRIYKNVLIKIIKRFERELEVIDKLMKKSQDDYFNKKVISKEEYNIAIDKHQERTLEIREILPVLKEKLNKRKSLVTKK